MDVFFVKSFLKNDCRVYFLVAMVIFIIFVANSFSVFAQPTITSFTPSSGPVGSLVTITGTNFSATPANNIVYFGPVKATVNVASPTSLQVTVPVGATCAPISVSVGGLTRLSTSQFGIIFSSSGVIDPASFSSKVDFATGVAPYPPSFGDIDNDGKTDIIIPNSGGPGGTTLSVFKNTSTSGTLTSGSFATAVNFTTGNTPLEVAVGDLDGDGKLDLVTANYNGFSVSVLRNTSTSGIINSSSFASKVDLSIGFLSRSVAIADIDGDGKPEIIASSVNLNAISILKNNSTPGTISFAAKVDFVTAAEPFSIATGDLDGDGKTDIAVGTLSGNATSLFRNTSTVGVINSSSLSTRVDLTGGTQKVLIADLNSDGKKDIVTNTRVFTNIMTGPGTFTNSSFSSPATVPYVYGVAEMNGDGWPDLVVSTGNDIVGVLKNEQLTSIIAPGSFTQVGGYSFPNLNGVIAADFDGDEKPDLVATSYSSNTISVKRNLMSSPIIASISSTSEKVGSSINITGSNFSPTPSNNFVYFGATRATVNSSSFNQISVTIPSGATYGPLAVILNGVSNVSNQFFDIIFPSSYSINGSSLLNHQGIYIGTGPVSSAEEYPQDMVLADLDGDGKPDITTVNSRTYNITTLRNNTSGTALSFDAKVNFPIEYGGFKIEGGDLDGDGKIDIVVTNNSGNISVLKNISSPGSISFQSKFDLSPISSGGNIAIADLDNDGRPDIAVTDPGLSTVSVFRNIGNKGILNSASFAAPVNYATGTNPTGIAIGDFNGDGLKDIVMSCGTSNAVSILRNTSIPGVFNAGSFATHTEIAMDVGTVPKGISIGDLDMDGRLDAVVANYGGGTITILRNNSISSSIVFDAKVDIATAARTEGVTIGDFDGDGKPDLGIAHNGNPVMILKNGSSPGALSVNSFLVKASYESISGPAYGISNGDLNGDSKPELMTIYQNGHEIYLFKNTVKSAEPSAHPASFTSQVSSSTQLNLTFAAISTIPNANGYIILRRNDGVFPNALNVNDATAPASLSLPAGTNLVGIINGSSTTTFSDLTLSPGIAYQYAIIPYNFNGTDNETYNYKTDGSLSTTSATTFSNEPIAQPTAVNFSGITNNSMTVSFTAASGSPTGYIALRKTGSMPQPADLPIDGTAYSIGTTVGGSTVAYIGSSTSFSQTGLSAGTEYYYLIISFNGSFLSTNYLTTTPLSGSKFTLSIEPTNQPTSVIFSNPTTSSLNVGFTNAIGNPTGYIALRKSISSPTEIPADGITYSVGNIIGTSVVAYVGSTASFTDTGLSPNTIYYYDIFSYNGSLATINYLTIAPLENSRITVVTEPVSQPTNLIFTSITNTSFSVSFTATSGGGSGYIALRKLGSLPLDLPLDGSYYSVGDPLGTSTVVYVGNSVNFNELALAPNSDYFYSVFSFNGTGEATNYLIVSPLSDNQLTTPDPPFCELDALTVSGSSFKAKWNAVSGSTSYEMEVSKDDFVTTLPGYGPKIIGVSSAPEELVSGLTSLTSYKFRVRSVNGGGASPNSNTVSVETNAPSNPLSVSQPVVAGNKLSVSVSGGSGARTVKYYSKGITSKATQFVEVLLTSNTDNYEATISLSELDELGLEYYFTAKDASVIAPIETSHGFVYKSIEANSIIPFKSNFDGTSGTYEMFSVPYTIADKTIATIFDELGGSDKTKWRLFRYQGGRYIEYPDNLTNIDLGRGYWLNAKEKIDIKAGDGEVVKANNSAPFTLTFEKGWNQIGNPYPFNIDWETIKAANSSAGLNSLWLFEGGKYVKKDVLATWKGAFVFSDNGGTVSFPVGAKTSLPGRTNAQELSYNVDEPSWQVPITLILNGLEQTSAIGMHPEALLSKDRFDEISIPRFVDYLEMDTYHEEFFAPNFASDVVPTADESCWLFTVSSNQKEGEAILGWDQQALFSSQSKLAFIDLQGQTFVDMKTTGQYRFRWRDGSQFKFIYSKEGELSAGITMLGNAFPNPFNGTVAIPYLLDEDQSNIEVRVYDLLGRKVKTLGQQNVKAGIQSLEWNGDNDQGSAVESGLYLYQLLGDKGILSLPKRLIKQ